MSDIPIRVCAVGVVRRGDSLLLGRRCQNDSAHGKYVMPGGGVHLMERMEDAAAREVLEETGIVCRVGKLLTLCQHFDDGLHRVIGFYEAEYVSGEPKGESDLDEPRFVPLNEAKSLDLSPRTREVLEIIEREADQQDPWTLTGEVAAKFLMDMEEREKAGVTPEHKAFLAECDRIYEQTQKKLEERRRAR